MTPRLPPPVPGTWLLAGLVALFAGAMVVRCLVGWDVPDAAWWTLFLLVAVVAWFWTRARWHRGR